MEGKVKGNRKQKLTNAAQEGFLGLKVQFMNVEK